MLHSLRSGFTSIYRRQTTQPLRPSLVGLRSTHASSSRFEQFYDVTPEQFDERVTKGGDKVVLVDFYADWCAPCKQLSPLLEKITSDPNLVDGLELDLVTVDTDAQPKLAQELGITSLPTVIAFKNGKQLSHFIGLQRIETLKRFVKEL